MNIQDLEQYTREFLSIPNVSFSGLEISTVKDMVEALTIVMEKYPALKNSICAIGNNEDINNQFNLIKNSNQKKDIKWEDFVVEDDSKLSTVSIGTRVPIIKNGYVIRLMSFVAIAYGNQLFGKDINELNSQASENAELGYHPKHCSNFKSAIYHEIGHVLEFILDLSTDQKLYEIIKEKSDNFKSIYTKISEYSLHSGLSDIIAEAFAEYMICQDSNDLISAIGTYIDKKYKCFSDNRIFKINQKYWIHLIRAEEKLSHKKGV